jgi:hypothetical protein
LVSRLTNCTWAASRRGSRAVGPRSFLEGGRSSEDTPVWFRTASRHDGRISGSSWARIELVLREAAPPHEISGRHLPLGGRSSIDRPPDERGLVAERLTEAARGRWHSPSSVPTLARERSAARGLGCAGFRRRRVPGVDQDRLAAEGPVGKVHLGGSHPPDPDGSRREPHRTALDRWRARRPARWVRGRSRCARRPSVEGGAERDRRRTPEIRPWVPAMFRARSGSSRPDPTSRDAATVPECRVRVPGASGTRVQGPERPWVEALACRARRRTALERSSDPRARRRAFGQRGRPDATPMRPVLVPSARADPTCPRALESVTSMMCARRRRRRR